MRFIILLFSVLFLSPRLQAQDLEEVFADDGISNIENNIIFSATAAVEGYFNIGYHRYLGKKRSIGLVLGYFVFNGTPTYYEYEALSLSPHADDYQFGYLIDFQYRRYLYDHQGFFWQYGFSFRRKSSATLDYGFFTLPLLQLGYRYDFNTKLGLSVYGGVGMISTSVKEFYTKPSIWNIQSSSLYFPLHAELSYNF